MRANPGPTRWGQGRDRTFAQRTVGTGKGGQQQLVTLNARLAEKEQQMNRLADILEATIKRYPVLLSS